MSKIFKVILGLSLLVSAQTETAAGKFARFLKAPSIALGVGSCFSLYGLDKYRREQHYYYLNDQSALQHISEQTVKHIPGILTTNGGPETVEALNDISNTKQKIRTILKNNYKNTEPEFIFFDQNTESPIATITCKDKFGIVIGNENIESKEALEFSVGHEYTHAKHNDQNTKAALRSTLPATVVAAYKATRSLGGRGRILSLAGATATFIGHKSLQQKHSLFCEFRADKESSSNPEINDAGAEFFELKALEEKKYLKHLDNTIAMTSDNGVLASEDPIVESIRKELNAAAEEEKMELSLHNLFSIHPPHAERAERLRAQAAKLRAEQAK